MGHGAFYVICPRASSQYVTPLVTAGSQFSDTLANTQTTSQRLATASRSCVSIRFTEMLAKAGGVADRIK